MPRLATCEYAKGVIETRLEPLSDSEDRELKLWFTKGSYSLLLKILDSKTKEQQVKSCNEAMNGTEGYTSKANTTLDEARRFQIAKEVLTKIANEPGKHSLVKLT